MTKKRNQLILGVITLTWVAGGTAYYYVNHKPFSPTTGLVLGSGIFNLLIALLLTILAGAVGRWTLLRLENSSWNDSAPLDVKIPAVKKVPAEAFGFRPVVRLVLEAALGYGLLALGFLLVGTTLGVNSWVIWIGTVIVILVSRNHLKGWLAQWQDLGRLLEGQNRLTRSLILGLGVVFFLTLLTSLAPPAKFDTLVYHLTLPEIYQSEGRVLYTSGNIFWGMPQTVEMLYTWALGLSAAPAAVTLIWSMAALSLLGVVGFVSQAYDEQIGWAVGAILLGGYSLAISTAWGYVDWAVFLFGFGFLVWIINWLQRGAWISLLMAGLMAGMALGTKYTAGLLIPVGLLVVLLRAPRGRKSLRPVLVFGGAALVMVVPWLVKNALATGNPFYPLLLPGGEMDPARLAFYQDHAPWGNWLDIVLLPVRATFLGLEGGPGYGASIGPLLLVFSVLAGFGWNRLGAEEKIPLTAAALITVFGLLGWVIAGRFSGLLAQTRMYLSIFPAVALLAGAGLQRISGIEIPDVRPGRIAQVLIGVVLWLNVTQVAARTVQMGSPGYHFGLVSSQQYLEANLGWYARAMETLQDLPESDRAILLWEPRGYYCNPRCESDEVLDRWVHELRTGSDPDMLEDRWRSEGYSHLLVYRAGADFIRQDDDRYEAAEWEALDVFLTDLPLVEDFGGTYELYRLEP